MKNKIIRKVLSFLLTVILMVSFAVFWASGSTRVLAAVSTPAPDASQLGVINIYNIPGQVVVSNLTVGDTANVYSAAAGGSTIGSSQEVSGTAVVVLAGQLANTGGTLYVSVTRGGVESGRTAVTYASVIYPWSIYDHTGNWGEDFKHSNFTSGQLNSRYSGGTLSSHIPATYPAYPGSDDSVDGNTSHNKHIIIKDNGSRLTFYGYGSPSYKDFMYLPSDSSALKTVTFNFDLSTVSFHTLEGAGFLFNMKLVSGKLSGYVVLFTGAVNSSDAEDKTKRAIKLYKLNNVDPSSLNNAATDALSSISGITQLAPTVYATGSAITNVHHITLQITQNSFTMIDTDNGNPANGYKMIDNFSLPTVYGGGLGFIASYLSHTCSVLSYLTFNDISISDSTWPIMDLTANTDTAPGQVNLTYTAPVGASAVVVQQSTDGTNYTTSRTLVPVTTTTGSVTITNLTNNTAYSFRVLVGGGINAGGSNVAAATPVGASLVVTFNSNGGETYASPPSKAVVSGNALGTLPTPPTRSGYTFTGWNTNAGGTGAAFTAATIVSSTQTVYAVWTPASYTVTLNPGGGSGGSGSVTATYLQGMPAASAPTRTGYTFLGFYDQAVGGTPYYTANMTSAASWTTPSVATLYAHWHANAYTVSFDANGGVYADGSTALSINETYDAKYSLPGQNPTRNGYTLASWNTADDGSGTTVSGATDVAILAPQTLNAIWSQSAAVKLTTSTNLAWDGTTPGKATWTAIANASSYTVSLYKGAALITTVTGLANADKDFTLAIAAAGTGSYTFTVTAVGDGTNYINSDAATVGTAYDYTAPAVPAVKLDMPTNLAWNGATPGKATWTAVNNASSYTVSLYKGAALITTVTSLANAYKDFTSDIAVAGTGSYTFTVIAVGDGTNYTNSDPATVGTPYSYTAPAVKLTTPANLAWDGATPGKATWTAVNNASSYTVSLYKGAALVTTVTGLANAYKDFTSDIAAAGTGSYTFTVTAVGDGTNYTNSDPATVGTAYDYTVQVQTYTVSGTVKDDTANNNAVVGATIKVMRGSSQVGGPVTTDANGFFTVGGISDGTYNLVVSNGGQEVILCITVSGGDYTYSSVIILPSGSKNSKLQIMGNDTPNVVEDGLNNLFSNPNIFTAADGQTVGGGGSVEIALTIHKNDNSPNKATVEASLTSNGYTTGVVMDVDITKTVSDNGNQTSSPITSTNDLITLIIPLPAALQGKTGYVVSRAHDFGQGVVADLITTNPNSHGEYIEVDGAGTELILHVKFFSTYAIAYIVPVQAPVIPYVPSITLTMTAGTGGSISPTPNTIVAGSSQTFTIKPDMGYIISDVLVDGVSVGPVGSFTLSGIYSSHTISAIFVKASGLPYYIQDGRLIFLGFSDDGTGVMRYIAPDDKTVLYQENPKGFLDTAGHWAKADINFVTEREIFLGTSAGVFSPDTGMTRGMFATVIGRLYEKSYGAIPVSGIAHVFTDVNYGAYYGDYVDWAAQMGIITDVGGGKFEPDREMTRQEMAAILYRFAQFLRISSESVGTAQLGYADTADIAAWAADAALYCQSTGIITGRSGGSFVPLGTASRAEVSAVLTRFIVEVMKSPAA